MKIIFFLPNKLTKLAFFFHNSLITFMFFFNPLLKFVFFFNLFCSPLMKLIFFYEKNICWNSYMYIFFLNWSFGEISCFPFAILWQICIFFCDLLTKFMVFFTTLWWHLCFFFFFWGAKFVFSLWTCDKIYFLWRPFIKLHIFFFFWNIQTDEFF